MPYFDLNWHEGDEMARMCYLGEDRVCTPVPCTKANCRDDMFVEGERCGGTVPPTHWDTEKDFLFVERRRKRNERLNTKLDDY